MSSRGVGGHTPLHSTSSTKVTWILYEVSIVVKGGGHTSTKIILDTLRGASIVDNNIHDSTTYYYYYGMEVDGPLVPTTTTNSSTSTRYLLRHGIS